MDFPHHPLKRLFGWPCADVWLAPCPVEPPDGVTQKVEGLTGHQHHLGLLLVDREADLLHDPRHRLAGVRPFSGTAADHEVIGIIHDHRIKRLLIAQLFPGQNKTPEVHVGQERGNDTALRRASPSIFGRRRSHPATVGRSLFHRSLQPARDHREHLPVGNPAAETFHQRSMRDGVEVVAQVGIDHFLTAFLSDLVVDESDRRLGIPARSKPHLLLAEVGLEDRTKHHHHRHLDHTITHRRYPERALSSVTFRYPYAKKGLRPILLRAQFLLQFPEPRLPPCGFDPLEGFRVHPGTPAIATAAPVGFREKVSPADLVPKAVKAVARFSLGFCL